MTESHHHTSAAFGEGERYRATLKVTLIGSVIDLALGVVKILFGITAHSQALIADGVHSLSDLGTDVLVIYAAKHAHREADEEHPYGHGRIETAATVGLGVALVAVAIGIGYDAVERLFTPERLLAPGVWALLVAFLSVVFKEAIYHYTMRVARRLRSDLLKANAWHSRTDAISSVVVMIGVGGTMAGLPYLDAIAAVAVAGMIAKIGWDLGWHSLRELVDTGLEVERVEAIRRAILGVDGVRETHLLRTRRMGQDALVDVHVLVDPKLSVSEGHYISEAVRTRLISEVEEVQDVLVHVDPEDDEKVSRSVGLPSRREVLNQLRRCWEGVAGADAIDQVTLHYLGGKVSVEVALPLNTAVDGDGAQAMAREIARCAEGEGVIKEVKVYFH